MVLDENVPSREEKEREWSLSCGDIIFLFPPLTSKFPILPVFGSRRRCIPLIAGKQTVDSAGGRERERGMDNGEERSQRPEGEGGEGFCLPCSYEQVQCGQRSVKRAKRGKGKEEPKTQDIRNRGRGIEIERAREKPANSQPNRRFFPRRPSLSAFESLSSLVGRWEPVRFREKEGKRKMGKEEEGREKEGG